MTAPFTKVRTSRERADVLRILATLDRTDQEALRLIYFHGLSQADAARELGLGQDAIRKCVSRGMAELARRLVT